MSDSPRDVGVLLKQEREQKGIALDVVHEATKIPLDALKAIEEGYKVRTLTAFYYKSFVKIYAQYLGLDANFIVTLIPTHHPKPAAPVAAPRPGAVKAVAPSAAGAHRVEGVRSRSWNLLQHPIVLKKKKKVFKAVFFIVLALLVAALVFFAVRKVSSTGMFNRPAQTGPKPVPKMAVKKVVKPEMPRAETLKAEPVKVAAPKAREGKPSVAPQVAIVATKAAVSPGTSVSSAVEAKVPSKPAEAAVQPPKRVSITVRAQTSTWIHVRADGVSVFQGHLKKGTASTWHGVKKIELSAKDIAALEFEVNGRNVGKLARRDLKAKKVVVTPEGLNVEK